MRKAILHLKKADPVMRGLIERIGPYRIEYSPPDFATIVRCIVYQQLSGKVALAIYNRLEAASSGGRTLTPAAILKLRPPKMRAVGLSQRKVDYIRDLATKCRDRKIDLEALSDASDAEVMEQLTSLNGVGPWTVHMFLIFSLRRPDVLPTGDLGIRVAVEKAYGLDQPPAPAEVERIGEAWRPWASVASWYLWRSLGDGAGL